MVTTLKRIIMPAFTNLHKWICLLSFSAVHILGDETQELLTYEATHNGVTITRCNRDTEVIVIPSLIEDLPVTLISDRAFSKCGNLTTIVLPDTVTFIGKRAFSYCRSLRSIKLSSNITSIEPQTFLRCESLREINIPEGVRDIGEEAFYSCPLTELTLPESLVSIGRKAFGSTLTSLRIPGKVTHIEPLAFFACRTVREIEIPRWLGDWETLNRIGINPVNAKVTYLPDVIHLSMSLVPVVDRNQVHRFPQIQCLGPPFTMVTIQARSSVHQNWEEWVKLILNDKGLGFAIDKSGMPSRMYRVFDGNLKTD